MKLNSNSLSHPKEQAVSTPREGLLQKVSRYLGLSTPATPTQNANRIDSYGQSFAKNSVESFQRVSLGRKNTQLPPDQSIIAFLDGLK